LRFCVTTDVLFRSRSKTPDLSWRCLYTAWVEFPRPNKIECFVHNDGDRTSKLLSLSLRYFVRIVILINFQALTHLLKVGDEVEVIMSKRTKTFFLSGFSDNPQTTTGNTFVYF